MQQVGVKFFGQPSLFRRFKNLYKVFVADLLAVKVVLSSTADGVLRRRSCLSNIVCGIGNAAVAHSVPKAFQLVLGVNPLALKGAPAFGCFRLKGFLVLLGHLGQHFGHIFRSCGFLLRCS